MREDEVKLNIYQKLAKIRKQVEVVKKNKAGYNYKYVSDDELLAKVTAMMDKYDISLIPSIVPNTMSNRDYRYTKTKFKNNVAYEENVNEVIVTAEMQFTWVDNCNPDDKIVVPWCIIGQQSDSSQAFGSGLTYAMRYFLLKYFSVATPDDDVDAWRKKQREAEVAEETAIAAEMIKELDLRIKQYLSDSPTETDKIKSIITKYTKTGNYLTITNPVLANKLLNEVSEYIKGNE